MSHSVTGKGRVPPITIVSSAGCSSRNFGLVFISSKSAIARTPNGWLIAPDKDGDDVVVSFIMILDLEQFGGALTHKRAATSARSSI